MLFKRAMAGCLLNIGLVSVCLLLPAKLLATEASRLWEEGMAFLGLYSVGIFLGCLYLCVYYPKSMEARLIVTSPSQPAQDKVATAVLSLAGLAALSFIPTDVFYLHALTEPTLLPRLVGLGLAQVGLILLFVTMVQNEFAQPVVSIQEDRGHVLVDTGLYGRVRHPLYTSFLIWFCGAALWLGSVMMASFGTGILMLALWPRILIEESTLKRDLDGYADYMRRVKHRIIPGLL
jgi:protein-S-isoprenylcysteine O-methyltransferase Ste14